jgi:hypothetical protein
MMPFGFGKFAYAVEKVESCEKVLDHPFTANSFAVRGQFPF